MLQDISFDPYQSTAEKSKLDNSQLDIDGEALRDRLKSLNGFHTKKIGVWDAVTLANAKQHQKDLQQQKIDHKRKQLELRKFYDMQKIEKKTREDNEEQQSKR